MDTWELLIRIILVVGVVRFFTRQFILYRRFQKRGLYDGDRIGVIAKMYYLIKGYRQAKKDFIRE